MKFPLLMANIVALLCLPLAGCADVEGHQHESHHHAQRKIIVTSPIVKDLASTESYVCQIHSRRHIEVCSLEGGYLQEIRVKEGQTVKQGEVMFTILPSLHQAKLQSDMAEAQLARIEFENTKKLYNDRVVSDQEVALAQAKLAKAEAEVQLSRTELNFTQIRAPFDGLIDRLHEQLGSLIEEGDMLTSLSDNNVMWVYFNVPEVRYLEYANRMDSPSGDDRQLSNGIAQNDAYVNGEDSDADEADDDADDDDTDDADADDDDEHEDRDHEQAGQAGPIRLEDLSIELVLANGSRFAQPGAISAIEAEFNNETGNIAFRADFPNPDGLLRHGQTGSILIRQTLQDAIVIPQRATFEILDKRYVFLVGDDNVAHQHEIDVTHELEDIYVIGKSLTESDKIVLEGVRQVRDGDKLEFEYSEPAEVLSNLKSRAE